MTYKDYEKCDDYEKKKKFKDEETKSIMVKEDQGGEQRDW